MSFECKLCNKQYSSYQSLWNHNKRFHTQSELTPTQQVLTTDSKRDIICEYCKKEFTRKNNMVRHQKTCKDKNKKQEINNKLENEIIELKKAVEKLSKTSGKKVIKNYNNGNIFNGVDKPKDTINNQLINIIMDKNKKIEELNTKTSNIEQNIIPIIEEDIIEPGTLILNNIVILSRSSDNYINATQICKAGKKLFKDWYRLETTKILIDKLSNKLSNKNATGADGGILPSASYSLIEINKGGNDKTNQETWIHPKLAVQLAQWISADFALQVSEWILDLFTNGKVEINIKLLKEKEKEIKLKDQKIKLLEDLCIKKQQRQNYPEKNVVYIVTTESNQKNRIYIIGKAKCLMGRLSMYNKTEEHIVTYYKNCKSEEDMNTVEIMVLNKLKDYREKANRDRFILPLEKDISLFTTIIDQSINFISNL